MGETRIQPSCDEARELFLPWMDGTLEPDGRVVLDRHLARCRQCAREWEHYQATVALVRSLEPLDVPDRVLQGIRERLHRPSWGGRILQWLVPMPRRIPGPVFATVAVALILVGAWQWRPWVHDGPVASPKAVASKALPAVPVDLSSSSPWWGTVASRGLPGADELFRPVRAWESDQEKPFSYRATLLDDLVLDMRGSEEVFGRVETILREHRGRMFLMGVRHRESGHVLRSRVLIEVPMENYERVVEQIEALGPVHRVFMDRDSVPPPPDRLRIRIVASDASGSFQSLPALRDVAWD
jgi:hypothetical protein